jgi:hypothetical protein
MLVAASTGYPYAVQLIGQHAWRASRGHAEITVDHARAAIPRAADELRRSMYRNRWESLGASPRMSGGTSGLSLQQTYLSELARHRDGSMRASQIARQLGRGARELSYLPRRLEEHGVIYRAADDSLHFALPGFQEWIRGEVRSG